MAATGTSSPLTSVPQTTPTLLPFFAKTASSHVSIYRLKGILISLLQVVSVSILIVIGFVTLLGLPLALCASMGAFIIFVGNATQEGTNNTSAAFIGVVGGLILSPLYLLYLIPLPPGQLRSDYAIGLTVLIILPYSTIIGAIGSSILLYCRVDLGGIDISYAALTGFLGGIILAIPAIFGSFLFCLLLTSVNSLIWSAIMKGVQCVHIKLTETRLDRSHSHSYGSRGGDPEINIGFQIPPGRD